MDELQIPEDAETTVDDPTAVDEAPQDSEDGDSTAENPARDPEAADPDAEQAADQSEPTAEATESTEANESPETPEATTDEDEEADVAPSPDAPEISDEDLVRQASALIFASPEPVSAGRLSKLLGGVGTARVRLAMETISKRLDQADLGLQLREIAGGITYLTTPDLGPVVSLLVRARSSERVSPAALETLAVVAYRQPVTKAEIEAIRGVQAGPILRTLVDRGLIRVTGRADVPGHPLQYGTTKEFLDRFGLGSLKDLPRDAELARG